MGKQYKVILYPDAEDDLIDIVRYLSALSPQASSRYYDLLTEQIASLDTMPERCPKVREPSLAAKGYRYLIVKDYLVFYAIVEDTVQVRRIFYGRRDYHSLL